MIGVVKAMLSRNRTVRCLYNWLGQFLDPLRVVRGLMILPWYFSNWRRYASLPDAEPIRLWETYPQLHDRQSKTAIDPHYFFVNAWAMRRILGNRPRRHVDIASQAIFANLLSAVVPVVFLDYRPLHANLSGLQCVGGNILAAPFADSSLESVSCLHVAEHIGLGRYGDPLDPLGTKKAARELVRILAPHGRLCFAVPVGRARLCFNAHRVHSPETIREFFSELKLVEFSGVHDDGHFVEKVSLAEFEDSEYACGMFLFQRS